MRQLIESLSPEACRIHWKWIGGVFAFYVAVTVVGAGLLMTHQSAKRLTQGTAAAATAQEPEKPLSVNAAARPRRQMAMEH